MKQAVRRKYHYIYKITRIDGSDKFYIGMHSTDNLDDGYFGSGSLLSRSIKKHGQDKHVKEILEHLPTREALKLREKELVNEELLGDKRCMNLKLGGHGGFDHLNDGSDSHKERASRGGKIALSASWQNHQFRERQSMLKRERSKRLYSDSNFSKSARFSGKQHSDQTRKKMSVSNAGKQTG